jgi:putative transposase
MAKENRLWGAERIRGELLKLGVRVSERTIQKYMPKIRRKLSQTWATFLKNHDGDIWASDFTVAHDLLFRPLYIFAIVHLQTRRIVHTAVTRSPPMTGQHNSSVKRLGAKARSISFVTEMTSMAPFFSNVAKSTGIKVLKIPVRAPQANAVCERFIGSLRRECLDHMLIMRSRQSRHVVREYVDYYNYSRPHQGIGQRLPARLPRTYSPSSGPITTKPVFGGVHHAYFRATHLH